MQSQSINYGDKSKIHNDYKALENHIKSLEDCRAKITKTYRRMEKSILELNEKGFQDGNFENLYQVFMNNVENIKKIESSVQKFEHHTNDLSQLIKAYYNVEL